MASGCGGPTSDTERASSALCERIPPRMIIELFDAGDAGANATSEKASVRADADPVSAKAGAGCRWSTGNSTLGVAAYSVSSDRLSSISNGPIDVGDGIQLFQPRSPDSTQCLADFTAVGGPSDQALTVVVVPDYDLNPSSKPPVDWCRRAVPAVKTVMKGLGWVR